MPRTNFKRVDLDRVYLPFVAVALEVVARCEARGVRYVATYGFRTFDEQAELRRLYLAGKGGKASAAGLSAHNYGLAFDFVCDGDERPGVQPDWRLPAYRVLGEETTKAGLVWGGRFGDAPHVQWPGYVSALQLTPLRTLAERSSVAAVWKQLENERGSSAWRAANPPLAAELARLGF
ncbi:M15 family metallopeptidase [Myxococcus llanfairpwllgwyngyllgogerychwyrndrobwllllantysiliogogogochensis]|uniref:M15 family metallopeptidase n=1 Tax=Myxococcus llanfairpwllgwyngyllgogerychwyrndrobwllllantysiliogogogochensis TaxID=2590453 RepID=A0A540WJK9_9BACT|nr:M15 family metallopeptidase [Myxococcus llanfairpwllgwyngyllgogerychwyrndrobwllllantysiliogogogochensis]TQF09181.1 M15 family metallopeptidase [Myxococcus llanfairpwllgwyngyllgogerychwyrndrobwllllantysiliogogogochensis]